MGIGANVMEGLIRESQYRPFAGTVYTLGRPTMGLTPAQTNELFRTLGAEPFGGFAPDDAVATKGTYWSELTFEPIRDVKFFQMLGFSNVLAIDIDSSEGAEIILDLNKPVPHDLIGTCDLLVDGSTLGNIFDPVTGLRNAASLLKPDGRIVLTNQGNYSTAFNGIPYLVPTPIWFYDYFCINRFVDCQVYITIWDDARSTYLLSHEHAGRKWDPGIIKPFVSDCHVQITVFAERDRNSSVDRVPTQHVYRTQEEWEVYEHVVNSIIARNCLPHLRSAKETMQSGVPSGYYHILPDWSIRNPESGLIIRDGRASFWRRLGLPW